MAKGSTTTNLPGICSSSATTGADFVRAIYFMPLAHTWDDKKDFDLEPERITTEDVEDIVAAAYPGEKVEFVPAGFLGQLQALTAICGSSRSLCSALIRTARACTC